MVAKLRGSTLSGGDTSITTTSLCSILERILFKNEGKQCAKHEVNESERGNDNNSSIAILQLHIYEHSR